MSIGEFSAAMKNKAIKEWFSSESQKSGADQKYEDRTASKRAYTDANVNVLINPTSTYRLAEQTAEKTSFLITLDTITELLVSLKGFDATDPSTKQAAQDLFKEFKKPGAGVSVNRKKITVGNGIPAIFFSKISFQGITTLVNNILKLNPGQLATQYEKGHAVGLNTQLLDVTRTRLSEVDTRGQAGKSKILAELDKVIEYYKRLDYDSTNLKPATDIAVYASVEKTFKKNGVTKYLVELQTKSANQRSADEVKATIGSIRKLFSPDNLSEAQMLKLIDKLQASVTDKKFQQDLLRMRSSPSYTELMSNLISSAILGNPQDVSFTHSNIKVLNQPVPKANLSEINKIAKTELAKVKKLRADLSRVVNPATMPGPSVSNLQALLTGRINAQVQKNMGTGSATNVLNYRSGRFANSVSIERLTTSREGMISVYYNYMRNPYATFSDGGVQQYPRTRDPKTLISKSIREIGASAMYNRMRAVLV